MIKKTTKVCGCCFFPLSLTQKITPLFESNLKKPTHPTKHTHTQNPHKQTFKVVHAPVTRAVFVSFMERNAEQHSH